MSESFSREDRQLAGPALKAFTQIAHAWSLSSQEQTALLGRPVELAFAILDTGIADRHWPETLERISYLIVIYRLLHLIFSDQQQADGWVRRPNSASLCKGKSALELMCSGQMADLAAVRQHLEANALG